METKIRVTSLTHDELVDFLSTALYGCDNFEVEVAQAGPGPELYEECKKKMGDAFCWEDGLAEVLLGGGCLEVIDLYDGDEMYYIDYTNILNGFSTPEGYKYAEELFDGDGDFFTAWNLLQIIIFGEVIYG